MVEARRCPSCGVKLGPGFDRCPRCRERLSDRPLPARPVASASSRPVAFGVAGVLILIALVMAWPRRSAEPERATAYQSAATVPAPPTNAAVAAPAAVLNPNEVPAEAPPFIEADREGNLEYRRGDFEAAEVAYREAVEDNPEDAESLSNLGQVLARQNRVAEAIPLFEKAIALRPDRWAYRFNLAHAYGELKQWDRAVVEYQEARELFPDDYITEYNLARALHKAGQEAEAVEGYLSAIALAPSEPTFRLSLGISYEQLGRAAEAAAAYRQYLELAPDAPDAEPVRARIAHLTDGGTPAGAPVAEEVPGR